MKCEGTACIYKEYCVGDIKFGGVFPENYILQIIAYYISQPVTLNSLF